MIFYEISNMYRQTNERHHIWAYLLALACILSLQTKTQVLSNLCTFSIIKLIRSSTTFCYWLSSQDQSKTMIVLLKQIKATRTLGKHTKRFCGLMSLWHTPILPWIYANALHICQISMETLILPYKNILIEFQQYVTWQMSHLWLES